MAKEALSTNTFTKEPLRQMQNQGAQFHSAIFGVSTFGAATSSYTKEPLFANSFTKEILSSGSQSKEALPVKSFTKEALSNLIT